MRAGTKTFQGNRANVVLLYAGTSLAGRRDWQIVETITADRGRNFMSTIRLRQESLGFRSRIALLSGCVACLASFTPAQAQITPVVTLAVPSPVPPATILPNHTAVALTATVMVPSGTGGPATPATGGTVTFFDSGVNGGGGAYQLGTAIVQGNPPGTPGNAVLNVSFAAGTHYLSATYNGITGTPSVPALFPSSSPGFAVPVGGTEQANLDCFFQIVTLFSTSDNTTNPNQVACGVEAYSLQPVAGTVNLTDVTSNTALTPIPLNSALFEPFLSAGSYGLQWSPSSVFLAANVNSFITADFANKGVAGLVGVNTGANELVLQVFQPTAQYAATNPNGGPYGGPISASVNNYQWMFPSGLSSPTGGTTLGVASTPVQVAAADVNADGNLDLVIAHNDPTVGVSVLLGNGNGTFQTEVTYPIGSAVTNIALGDVNGDGFPDLVVTNGGGQNQLTVLLNNGNGTFTQGSTLSTGSGPAQVALTDVNGDGILDVEVLNLTDIDVGIFLGNGDGTFQPMATYPSSVSTTAPVAFAITDWNLDGYQDIIVGGVSTSTGYTDATMLLGVGDGTFQPYLDLRDITCAGVALTAIQATDMNGDGVPDILVGTNVSAFNYIINNPNIGNNGFAACGSEIADSGTLATFNSLATSSLSAADLSGTGAKNVLLIANGSNFGVPVFGSTVAGADVPLSITTPLGTNTIDSTFTPSAGSVYGPNTFFAVPLTISPVPIVTLNPSSVTFTNVAVGASPSQTVTVTNTGTANLVFGANPVQFFGLVGSFGFSTTCGGVTLLPPPAVGNCTITVTFSPTLGGSQSTALELTDNAAGGAQGINLSGTAVGIPQATFSTTSVDFGNVQVNSNYMTAPVTVTNTGTDNLIIGSISTTFGILGVPTYGYNFGAYNCVGVTITPGSSCTITAYFQPFLVGFQTATLSVSFNAAGSPQLINLSGTGTGNPPAITMSYCSTAAGCYPIVTTGPLDFGSVPIFTMVPMYVTMTNSGDGAFVLPPAPFVTFTPDTGSFLSPIPQSFCWLNAPLIFGNSNCTFALYFVPQTSGPISATLSIAGVTQTIPLTGNSSANASIAVSPTSLAFGNQALNVPSASQTVTLTNNGNTPFSFSGISFSNGAYFQTLTGTPCVATLAVNASCTIGVAFNPTANGATPATMMIGGVAQTVALTGTGGGGVAVMVVSPTSLAFGNQALGTTSASQPITITNNGGASFTFQSPIATTTNPAYLVTPGTCGATLAGGGAFCTIGVTFTPNGNVSIPATLTVGGVTQTVSLTGTGTGTTSTIVVSPTALAFGSQMLGTTSASQPVTLTNNGTSSFTFQSPISTTTDPAYVVSPGTCGATLAAGVSCAIGVTFTPAATGSIPATLTIGGVTQTVSLNGTGATSTIGVSPTTIAFGNEPVGSTSANQTITLTNNGAGSFTFQSPIAMTSNAAYLVTPGTCTATLAAGAPCTIGIRFTPGASGSIPATLTIGGVTQTVSLTGTGTTSTIGVSPTAIAFGNQALGTPSASQPITITNDGGASFTFQSPIATTSNAAYLVSPGTCGATLAAGVPCTIGVTFTPGASGSIPATLTIGGVTQTVSLTGTGTTSTISVSPTTIAFGNEPVGSTSANQSITLTNNGTASFTFQSPIATTSNAAYLVTPGTCGTTLAAGVPCTIGVTFTPGASGPTPATLTIGGVTQTVSLTGTGVAATPVVTLNPTSLAFGDQQIFTISGSQTITVTNTGTANLTFPASPLTAGPGSVVVFYEFSTTCSGITLAPNVGSCTITVAFAPAPLGPDPLTLRLADNAPNSPQLIPLTGIGIGPIATLTSSNLVFGNQPIDSTSAGQTVTITNTGNTNLRFPANPLSLLGTGYRFSTTCGGVTLAPPPAVGSCTVTVYFAPTALGALPATLNIADNENGTRPSITLSGTGTQASQTITFAALATEPFGTAPFTVSATASSGLAVSFASTTAAVCTVSGNTVTLVAPGKCTIQASQAGNADYLAATPVDRSFQVTRGSQTITFAALSNRPITTATFLVHATASSGLNVTFTSTTTPVCTVSGRTVSLLTLGTCTIQASQAGNADYTAATPVDQSFQVVKASQTITFAALAGKTLGSAPFTVSATASSGLTVHFASTTTPVCKVTGTTVTLVAAGTCTIEATQAGNADYAAATPVNRSFQVTP